MRLFEAKAEHSMVRVNFIHFYIEKSILVGILRNKISIMLRILFDNIVRIGIWIVGL